MNEADTCQSYVMPKLRAAGWDREPCRIAEQVTFTDGRVVLAGTTVSRRPRKRADYILRYTPDLPLAIVEAKRLYRSPGQGLQPCLPLVRRRIWPGRSCETRVYAFGATDFNPRAALGVMRKGAVDPAAASNGVPERWGAAHYLR